MTYPIEYRAIISEEGFNLETATKLTFGLRD